MYRVAPSAVWVERASLVMALASAWSTYQCVSPASFSQALGNPLGVPLYPSDTIIPSRTIRAPTCFRVQWDNWAHSRAILK